MLLLWVTSPFITKNTHTVFYFESTHTPPCCCKYSLEHMMCVNPQQKIVPDKCLLFKG